MRRSWYELKPFYIPVYAETRRRPWQLKLGLWVYALLGGFDASTRFGSVPKREWRELDGLETRNLDAVIRYYDAQTDDAQLTRAVVDSALALGGELARCRQASWRPTSRTTASRWSLKAAVRGSNAVHGCS